MFGAIRINSTLARHAAIAAFCLVFAVAATPARAQQNGYAQQLETLRQDIRDLQRYVYSDSYNGGRGRGAPPPQGGGLPGDAATRLHFKLQSLDSQVREMTGRMEEIENRLRISEDRLNRLIGDVDLRLRSLEQRTGISPTADAAGAEAGAQTGMQMPSAVAGQAQPGPSGGLVQGQKLLGTVSPNDVAGVNKSAQPASTSVASAATRANMPVLPEGSPKEQYAYAFDLLKKRDYGNAARSLQAFVDKHPKHELADNAMYWLGETRYDQKQYAAAARIFLDGFKRYPKSSKAPDYLLKLGKSLNSAGEKKSACAAWKKLLKEYGDRSARIKREAEKSISSNNCV
jgi:tol-pal system protein YbgF